MYTGGNFKLAGIVLVAATMGRTPAKVNLPCVSGRCSSTSKLRAVAVGMSVEHNAALGREHLLICVECCPGWHTCRTEAVCLSSISQWNEAALLGADSSVTLAGNCTVPWERCVRQVPVATWYTLAVWDRQVTRWCVREVSKEQLLMLRLPLFLRECPGALRRLTQCWCCPDL